LYYHGEPHESEAKFNVEETVKRWFLHPVHHTLDLRNALLYYILFIMYSMVCVNRMNYQNFMARWMNLLHRQLRIRNIGEEVGELSRRE
jgi:hypothetical protein